MPLLGIKIPKNISDILSKLDVPGIKEDSSGYHITLLYFKVASIKDILEAAEEILELTSKSPIFNIKFDNIECFPEGDDGVPIICPVVSDDLFSFHKKLKTKIDKTNLDYSKKFPEYKPHITLSYNKEKIKSFELEPIEYSVSEIIFWCGDNMDEKMTITFPLNIEKKANMHLFEICKMYEKIIKDSNVI